MEIKKSNRKNKKYMIKVNNKWIHFGYLPMEHYKDSTPIKLYSNKDHNDSERRRRFMLRFTGVPYKKDALKRVPKYTPIYFSIKYLW